jgi:hypothetical protein
VRTPIRLVAALALGAATAVLVSCGGTSTGLIPDDHASTLSQELQNVADDVAAQRCASAIAAGQRVVAAVTSLPPSVDGRLQKRLAEGTQRLIDHIPGDCRTATTTTTTSTDTTPDTETATSTDTTPETDTTPTTDTTPIETDTTPTDTTPSTDGGGDTGGGLGFP